MLFLSSDTGGGHRASAESLAKQFLLHYPGSTYDLFDVWTYSGVWPYRTLVDSYKHLSAHPTQWKTLYHLSNSLPWEIAADIHTVLSCERKIRRKIKEYNPDVIVSVHPAMNHVPRVAATKISRQIGRHIPFFTVVTDLGSAHCTWFQKHVDKLYVASERLVKLAKRRGRTPKSKIVLSGLPIRHDFAVQSELMGGDRTTQQGRDYQLHVKKDVLQLDYPERPMILLMGGGEGVGSLQDIVSELYLDLVQRGADATICVVCGRNEKLKKQLENRDWDQVTKDLSAIPAEKRRKRKRWWRGQRKHLKTADKTSSHEISDRPGQVQVVGLGFVTNMAEYMVAADVLVSKAGPGTIAEAAAVGLPVMLTSFLPGQEAGNVDYVLEKGFGDYFEDPVDIAEQVSGWLQNREILNVMSHRAREVGHPAAAAEIVLDIGSTTHAWLALNGVAAAGD